MTPLDQAFIDAEQQITPHLAEFIGEWCGDNERNPMAMAVALLEGSYTSLAMWQIGTPELRYQAIHELADVVSKIIEARVKEAMPRAENVIYLTEWKALRAR